jgi:anti-sigma-K factor RskA/putative zinc finger protein
MNPDALTPAIRPTAEANSHQEFRELCALSVRGPLPSDEHSRLERHLAGCSACSDLLMDYKKIARLGLSSVGPDLMPDLASAVPLGSTVSAKRKVFERLRSEGVPLPTRRNAGLLWRYLVERFLRIPVGVGDFLDSFRQRRYWRITGAIFFVGISLVSVYRLGERRGSYVSNVRRQSLPSGSHVLEQQVGSLARDGQALAAELRKRDRIIEDITNSRNRELLEVARLKEQEKNLQDAVTKAGEREGHLASERDTVTEQLKLAQASLAKTEEDLAGLRQQREANLIQATDLETRIAGLSQRLKDREDTIEEQQRLLAADRDIRELMGARDLYLAEVYDVGRNGDTQKPFGRIFFTKNKSLIFYAYDLDQQPGVKNTSAFQAWGQRGPDRKRTLSLGIFYQDNAANNRWVLKVEDPKTLQQIDAVFVTVEPQGGSREPSGHRLLVASLRVEPNHP